MTEEFIKALHDDLDEVLNASAEALCRANFYEMVLRQAVLTHGGELRVDPSLMEAANADRRALVFGQGGVRLVDLKKTDT